MNKLVRITITYGTSLMKPKIRFRGYVFDVVRRIAQSHDPCGPCTSSFVNKIDDQTKKKRKKKKEQKKRNEMPASDGIIRSSIEKKLQCIGILIAVKAQ